VWSHTHYVVHTCPSTQRALCARVHPDRVLHCIPKRCLVTITAPIATNNFARQLVPSGDVTTVCAFTMVCNTTHYQAYCWPCAGPRCGWKDACKGMPIEEAIQNPALDQATGLMPPLFTWALLLAGHSKAGAWQPSAYKVITTRFTVALLATSCWLGSHKSRVYSCTGCVYPGTGPQQGAAQAYNLHSTCCCTQHGPACTGH
jgi:hypothetical protein